MCSDCSYMSDKIQLAADPRSSNHGTLLIEGRSSLTTFECVLFYFLLLFCIFQSVLFLVCDYVCVCGCVCVGESEGDEEKQTNKQKCSEHFCYCGYSNFQFLSENLNDVWTDGRTL